jgi:hypothetical protein
MKRAVFGAHHSVSEAHLHRYLVEWDYKWNTRKLTDGERAAVALKGAEGRRLTYQNTDRTTYAEGKTPSAEEDSSWMTCAFR